MVLTPNSCCITSFLKDLLNEKESFQLSGTSSFCNFNKDSVIDKKRLLCNASIEKAGNTASEFAIEHAFRVKESDWPILVSMRSDKLLLCFLYGKFFIYKRFFFLCRLPVSWACTLSSMTFTEEKALPHIT